ARSLTPSAGSQPTIARACCATARPFPASTPPARSPGISTLPRRTRSRCCARLFLDGSRGGRRLPPRRDAEADSAPPVTLVGWNNSNKYGPSKTASVREDKHGATQIAQRQWQDGRDHHR